MNVREFLLQAALAAAAERVRSVERLRASGQADHAVAAANASANFRAAVMAYFDCLGVDSDRSLAVVDEMATS